jgi:hypothetical protein
MIAMIILKFLSKDKKTILQLIKVKFYEDQIVIFKKIKINFSIQTEILILQILEVKIQINNLKHINSI